MSTLYDALNIGISGLMAQQSGVQMTANNINNANTEGYHRQDITLTPMAYGGVSPSVVQRQLDELLEAQVNQQGADYHYSDLHSRGLDALQQSLSLIGDGSLTDAVGSFFSGFRALSSAPEDLSVRTDALSRSARLATQLNSTANNIVFTQQQADAQMLALITSDNKNIINIAQLNVQIATAEAAGHIANELRDQRDLAIKELTLNWGAKSFTDAEGMRSVVLGDGISIVSGSQYNLLGTTLDATTNYHHVSVKGSSSVNIDSRLATGKAAAYIALRDNDTASFLSHLDTFTTDFATALNTIHSSSYGLDGSTGNNFFTLPTSGSASLKIALNTALVGNPMMLAASQSSTTLPGDNSSALAVALLSEKSIIDSNSLTPFEAIGSLAADLGSIVAQAYNSYDQADAIYQDGKSLVDAISGISLDEQILILSRYQAAFAASTKVLSVVTEMQESIIKNLVRV